MATAFKYLGRALTAPDDNWMAMVENLQNPQNLWVQLSRIFGREGEDHRTSRKFYKAVF